MSFLNSYICPQCKTPFPFFIKISLRINRGLLGPYIKCPKCGQICRSKIDLKSAVWIWPIAIGYFVLMIYILRTYFCNNSLLYLLIGLILLLPPFAIMLRKGFVLVPINHNENEESTLRKWILPTSFIILSCLIIGYFFGDSQFWLAEVAIGLIVGFLVWGVFYKLSGNKAKN